MPINPVIMLRTEMLGNKPGIGNDQNFQSEGYFDRKFQFSLIRLNSG